MDNIDAKILNYLQQGMTLSSRPYQDMADELGIAEEEVLARIQKLRDRGLIRRLGGVFDSPKMGMKSTLCAMEVPQERIEEVAKLVNAYREVTHNYLRNDRYNMWFTVTASSSEELERILQGFFNCNFIIRVYDEVDPVTRNLTIFQNNLSLCVKCLLYTYSNLQSSFLLFLVFRIRFQNTPYPKPGLMAFTTTPSKHLEIFVLRHFFTPKRNSHSGRLLNAVYSRHPA